MSKVQKAVTPLLIENTNLSSAWAEIVSHILEHPGKEISPLVVSLHGFEDQGRVDEHPEVRLAVDRLYEEFEKSSVENVAFTIFPQRYWEISQYDRATLFSLYRDSFPRIQAMNRSLNGRGLYFQRMVMFGSGPCDGNQLEWIISQYRSRSGVRRSMLQASVFDPGRDHVATAQLGFPCLQNVSFEPTTKGLIVNAFYATQQVFDKAYGNYLGLVHLGNFMAAEMESSLVRVNVFVGIAKLERITKGDPRLRRVLEIAKSCENNENITAAFASAVE